MRRLLAFVALACMASSSAPRVWAAPATYTIAGTLSGSLNSVGFTNQLFTFTTVSDTTLITTGTAFGGLASVFMAPGVTTFTSPVGSGTLIGSLSGFSGDFGPTMGALLPGRGIVGIGDPMASVAPLFIYTSDYLYNLSTGTTFNGTGGVSAFTSDGGGVTYPTSIGDLLFSTNPSGPVTFNAVIASSGVPEIDPAGLGSVLALVTGAIGLLERRRSRR